MKRVFIPGRKKSGRMSARSCTTSRVGSGMTRLRHACHPVHALHRAQLFNLGAYRQPVRVRVTHAGLHGGRKRIPGRPLLGRKLELLLQRCQVLRAAFLHARLHVLPLTRPAARLAIGTAGGGGVGRCRQDAATRKQGSERERHAKWGLGRFDDDLLERLFSSRPILAQRAMHSGRGCIALIAGERKM